MCILRVRMYEIRNSICLCINLVALNCLISDVGIWCVKWMELVDSISLVVVNLYYFSMSLRSSTRDNGDSSVSENMNKQTNKKITKTDSICVSICLFIYLSIYMDHMCVETSFRNSERFLKCDRRYCSLQCASYQVDTYWIM